MWLIKPEQKPELGVPLYNKVFMSLSDVFYFWSSKTCFLPTSWSTLSGETWQNFNGPVYNQGMLQIYDLCFPQAEKVI